MTQVQIEIPDSDRDLFVRQARREGMTLSAWLHAAGRARLERQQSGRRFASGEDVMAFFRACDNLDGPVVEPDWSEHLRVINESRTYNVAGKRYLSIRMSSFTRLVDFLRPIFSLSYLTINVSVPKRQ